MFSKLGKKKKAPHDGPYRSESAPRELGHERGAPRLVVGDTAPPVPPFGREGLHANTVYEVKRRSPSPDAKGGARGALRTQMRRGDRAGGGGWRDPRPPLS